MESRRHGSRRGGRALGLTCALGAVISFGLAACSAGPTANSPTPTNGGTTPTTAAGVTVTPTLPPTLTPASTAPAEAGAGDICDQPANVAAAVPSSIPGYPGAHLHISYITNNDGLFGYCSSASASAIAVFYAQQLPGKGWGSIQTSTLGDHQQVAATMGSSQVVVTAWPDSTLGGTTDILIAAQGI